MRKGSFAVLVVAALGVTGVARAEGAPGFHEHDGFFLHLEFGAGGMASKTSSGPLDVQLSGGGSQLAIALGGAVTQHLVLAGQLWVGSVARPDVKVNGTSLGSVPDSSLSLVALGLNVTYYLPLEFYLSAAPGVGTLSAQQGGNTFDSKSGFALRLAVGKEWWVSDSWELGLNLQTTFAANKASDTTNAPTWNTAWVGLAFSATYN